MRRLTVRRRPARGDDGAIAATVALLLGVGVLLGVAAVVVDVGRLYAEREQLQSGADAAAWAIGEGCATTPAGCADQASTAGRYADGNAADAAATVTAICGTGPGLPPCPAAAENRTGCLGVVPQTVPYAEVRVETRLPDGTTVLPPVFARTLSGGYDGTSVGACARVAWGPPKVAEGFGVTFSLCEWQELTGNGTTFWPSPAVGVPPAAAERVIRLKGPAGVSTCPAGPSGWDRPGGFGWLDDPSASCAVTVEADGTFGGNTGNSVSKPCKDAMEGALEAHSVVLIPVYDTVRSQGARTTYHLTGFASFVLTGYAQSGFSAPSWLSGRRLCGGSERCLYGYFVRGLVRTTGAEIGGPDLGAAIVNLVG
ncbi:pilus assembly protein TadG-related protein [Actinoplanes sp. NPDC051475]|uniref:pilus assembly protein TadG-related protein n=1 Tax=Actinoplanes sp. NPDC051475 TaxID=3157225 RepID=UPI00344BF42A